MDLMLILQVAVEAATEVAEQPTMNLWTMATYGGPIMIVLALMLAFGVYLFIERMVTLKQASKEDSTFMNRIKDYIYEGKIESAIKLCREVNTPSARMVEKGISRLGRPMNDVLVAIENVGNLEVAQLEKGMVIMASISGGAPMLGLNGLVVKTHGSSDAKEVCNSIFQCVTFKEQQINEKIRAAIQEEQNKGNE